MKRSEANEIRNTIIDECEKHQYCRSCPFYNHRYLDCSLGGGVGFWVKDDLYVRKRMGGA